MNNSRKMYASLLLMVSLLVLQGCVKPQTTLPAANAVADAVLKSQVFSEPYQITEEKMLEFLAISAGDIADSAMIMDVSRVTPECIIILTAASDSAAKTVEQALKDYRQNLRNQYISYRPDEVFKIDQAVLDSRDYQFALIISSSPEQAQAALKAAWK